MKVNTMRGRNDWAVASLLELQLSNGKNCGCPALSATYPTVQMSFSVVVASIEQAFFNHTTTVSVSNLVYVLSVRDPFAASCPPWGLAGLCEIAGA